MKNLICTGIFLLTLGGGISSSMASSFNSTLDIVNNTKLTLLLTKSDGDKCMNQSALTWVNSSLPPNSTTSITLVGDECGGDSSLINVRVMDPSNGTYTQCSILKDSSETQPTIAGCANSYNSTVVAKGSKKLLEMRIYTKK